MKHRSSIPLLAALIGLAGCSSSDPAGAPDGGATEGGAADAGSGTALTADETWADGKAISGSVTVGANAKVTIAAAAKVTVAAGATVTVLGQLTAASAATHAQLTGTGWTGVVIGAGGVLAVDGVDISGADVGIRTQAGAGSATYSNGTVTATAPFYVGSGTTLSVSHAKAVAKDQSTVEGTFKASYLDYDKSTAEGITSTDPKAQISIDDSTLHGGGSGDYVVSQQGAHVHVAYTTINGAHCAFHFDSVDAYDIDHVTANGNNYGAMLYGSGVNPSTIKASNFQNSEHDLASSGQNGPLTIDGTYMGSHNLFQTQVPPKVTNAATGPVADAKPR